MLDREVWQNMKKHGADYPFKKISAVLHGSDIVLGNLEGPFTTSQKHSVVGGSLSFTFDPTLAPSLKRAGFTTLSVANNHTLNQGQAGLNATRTTLKTTGLDYFGDPKNRTGFVLNQEINGHRVTFIGYHGLVAGLDSVLAEVRAAHSHGYYVIMVPHEGVEYQLKPSTKQRNDYHQLIDAGADMILGSHPHVVQPLEVYKGKLIAYSLGNFVFDQYFSAETQRELMVKINFTQNNITVRLIPLTSVRSQVAVADNKTKTVLLERLAKDSNVSYAVRDGIRRGIVTLRK